MRVRLAVAGDAPRLAELHATRMTEGFLSALGPRFLRILYRRIVASPDAFAHVAEEPTDGSVVVVGFAASALDVRDLYRRFIVRDGVIAGIAAAPELLRSWRKVIETLRYPASTDDLTNAEILPSAEILSVAVDPRATGRGIGTQVVEAATAELTRRGVTAAKVVTGADNVAALRLYERCGFVARERIAVHEGTPSEVLVWSSS